jgi:protein SCO1/2
VAVLRAASLGTDVRRRTIALACVGTAILAGALAFAIGSGQKAAPANASSLPVLWRVPEFSFHNQHGRPTVNADLRGHVWIADFIFTRCTTICPLITAKMALLQRRLPDNNLRFVSFSVDPERDTPHALQRYAAEWRPGESRWVLLSTTAEGLKSLSSGMFTKVSPTEKDILHSELFFLVDAQGAVRGIYESAKNDALERLVRDSEALSAAAPAAPRDEVRTGAEVYATLSCSACHERRDLAPPLDGLVGRRVSLQGGGELSADVAYIREAIVAPGAKIVAGYLTLMPSYEGELTPRELDLLVEHVAMLRANDVRPVLSQEPVTDPVCSMKVRVTDETPQARHAGQAYHFCSESCRDRFLAEPGQYLSAAKR